MPNLFFHSSKPRFVNEKKVVRDLKKLAKKVAGKHTNVEAVYLFGSYAAGNAGLRSDADILVVLRQGNAKFLERTDEFILEFSDGPVPVDVLVYSRSELNTALKNGNRFLARAVGGLKLA